MFKKALSLLLALMLVVTSLTVTAFSVSAAGDDETWIIAGVESFFGSNWMETDVNNQMEAVGDGTYTKVYEDVAPAEGIQFKVTNGSWEVSYPQTEANFAFDVVEACDVTINFNPADGSIEVVGDGVVIPDSLDIQVVNAVGAAVKDSPNWLNGFSWDPTQNEMVELEPGVWTATFEDCQENNNFQVKFALNGTTTQWKDNLGGAFVKTGEWTDAVYNGDNIVLNLDDNDDDADDLVYDITLTVDVSNFDYATKSGAKFKVDVTDKEGNALNFPVEEEEPTTEPAADETTAPAQDEETTAAAAEDDSALTVTATSNYFPTAQQKFTEEELAANDNLVTVTYFIDLGDIEMINAAFVLTYDPTVLKYDAANNTYKIGRKTVTTIMPYVNEFGGVVDNPSFDDHTMKGNCSDAQYGYPMTPEEEGGHPVALVSVTFEAIGTGSTDVNLELELMQVADKDAGESEYYYVKDSAIVKDDVVAKTQSSVYAGPYNEEAEATPEPATVPATDPVEETTAEPTEEVTTAEPTTEAETTVPETEPETGDVLTVNAISNILASSSQTFKGADIPEQVNVKYYLDSDTATLVNAQTIITYDPAVLSLKQANNQNNKKKWTLSPVALDWGVNTVVNLKTDADGNEVGEVKINFSDMDGIDLSNGLPLFEIVFDVVGTGETTVDNQVETITFKDAGTPTDDAYWYQPQTKAGGFNQADYDNLTSKSTMKTTINDKEGPVEEPTTAEPTAEPTTEPVVETTAEPVEEGYFYVVGNAALCPNGWDSAAAIADGDTQMHLNSDGLYEFVFENLPANEPKAMYQLKVIEAPDNDPAQVIWHGLDGTDLNVDFVVTEDCDVTVTYNPETGEIKVSGAHVSNPSADYDVIRVVGGTVSDSPNYMNGISWNPAADENTMEKVSDGVYSITFTDIVENSNLLLKFTADSQNSGDWSINWGGLAGERVETENGYVIEGPANYNGDNIVLDCEDDDDDVDFVYDLTITFDLTEFNASTKEGAKFTATFVRQGDEEPTTAPVEEPTTEPVEPTTVPAEPTTEESTTEAPAVLSVDVATVVNTDHVDALPKEFALDGVSPVVTKVGDTFTLTWKLDTDATDLVAVQWVYTYDASTMELVSAEMPQITSGGMINTETPGSVQGNASDINGYAVDASQPFIVLTFKATAAEDISTAMILDELKLADDEEPTTTPVEEPTTEPVEEPTTVPVEEPTTTPVEEPTTTPVEEPTTVPVEEPTTVPVEEPTTVPVEEPTTVPVEEPTTVPVEEPTTTPVEEPTTVPVEEPTTTPVEEPTTTPVEEPTTVEPATDATSATGETVAPTTKPASTSDTPSGNNNNNSSNGAVKTGSASMALIILIVLLSATAAIFFARKRERK